MTATSAVPVHVSNADQLRAWDGDEGAYWAEHADYFDRSVAAYHQTLLATAAITSTDRVLDVGCGTGQTTRDAARAAADGSALGVDLSARMLEYARRRAAEEGVPNAGDVAINDHGGAVAAWTACRGWPTDTCYVQRSIKLARSRAWTAPVTIGRNAHRSRRIEVASAPGGFTAITWIRLTPRQRTVVDLGTARGIWSRHVLGGLHDSLDDNLAVGPHRTVAMLRDSRLPSGGITMRAVTWRTNRTDWTTTRLTPRGSNAWVLTTAIDSRGRIYAPWSQWRERIPQPERAFMSTHLSGWATTELWGWTRNSRLMAAAVSWNGRAVAIRIIDNLRGRTGAVQMRVLRPT